jgi:hypothetical protein
MGRGLVAVLSALGSLVLCLLTAGFAIYKFSKEMDKQISDKKAYELTQDELREVYEEIGERLSDDSGEITVAISAEDGMAYWVENNTLMYAPVDEDGEVDFEQEMQYNAFEVPLKELTKMLLILDTIKENK